MKKIAFCISIWILFIQIELQAQFQLQNFVSGFTLPLGLYHSGDERLFVVEKSGLVKIVLPNGAVQNSPFLDIQNLVRFTGQSNSEQGLLGFAFHPDFKNNGYFFVDYTRSSPINDGATVIARYQINPNDSNLADVNSAEIILTVPQAFSNHNGGCIQFGADGFLYIGMGDGGSANDPLESGQNTQTLQGKMLRIDVNGNLPFEIPASNPFINDPNVLDEIWAIGVRNPWRFSFDRISGDLWMGDVGQNNVEEINFQAANSIGGENYGWDCFEGNTVFEPSGCNNITFTFPIFEYNHNAAGGFSVTGGYVYRSAKYKNAWGKYLFADAVNQHLWATEIVNGNFNTIKVLDNAAGSSNVSFGEDVYGDLYIIKHTGGVIQKIIDTSNEGPKAFLLNSENHYSICEGANVRLQALYHPDLQFQWLRDGQMINAAQEAEINISEAGMYSVIVTDTTNSNLPADTSSIVEVEVIPSHANLFLNDTLVVPISNPPFAIATLIAGGIFSGTGIVNDLFDASVAEQENEIIYTIINNNCPQRDTLFIALDTLNVATSNIAQSFQFNIFPNPVVHQQFKITAQDNIEHVKIFDVLGHQLYKSSHVGVEHQIQLPNVPAGVYFLEISSASKINFRKLYVF